MLETEVFWAATGVIVVLIGALVMFAQRVTRLETTVEGLQEDFDKHERARERATSDMFVQLHTLAQDISAIKVSIASLEGHMEAESAKPAARRTPAKRKVT